MRSLVGLTLAALLATVLAACDDGGGGDECEDVIDACTEEGATQCSGDQVQECMEDADGCLAWTNGDRCGDNQSCTVTGGTASCECDDTCETDGDSQCDGSVVQECSMDSDGCLVWDNVTNCETSGQSCDDSSGDAECVGGCESDCTTEDATRCAADVVETCTDMGSDCLQWRETTDCTDDDQICEEMGGTASCVTPCTPDCDVEDESRCSTDDDVEICTDVGDGCLQWQLDDDCDDTTEVCDDTSDPASCVDACVPTCDTADAVQCSTSDDVETCTDVGGGCLQWQMTDDCDDTTEFCDETLTPPACALLCVSDCSAVDDTQCGATSLGVETCTDVGGGCLHWVLTDDCAAGFRSCDDTATPAVCGGLTAGDSCADPIVVTADSTTISGTDFTADFTDMQALGGTDCVLRTGAAEAVLRVDLAAGEGIRLREPGSLDAVMSLQTTCGDAEACVFSTDAYTDEMTGRRYQATADETVYLIVEAYYSSPSARTYEIDVDIWTNEECGDGLDNDLDGLIDCDDSDCFGDATSCTTETNCGDGHDNDGDTFTDCADSDCTADAACEPIQGIYQRFEPGEAIDLAGASIVFTPDATAAMGYTYAVTPGLSALPVTSGTGTATTALTLTDDSSAAYAFTVFPGFDFYGVTYDRMWVGSNGGITFDGSVTTYSPPLATFFAHPVVAPFWTDLNPYTAGTVGVDEFADRVVVSYEGVPRYGLTSPNVFQAILNADGSIEIHLLTLAPAASDKSTTVGIAMPVGVTPYPDPVDFLPPPPPAVAGDVIMTEVHWNPDIVDDAYGEFIELYNGAGIELDLDGCTIADNTGSHTITGVTIPADGYLVLVRSADPAANGGIAGGHALGSDIQLRNSAGENLTLTCGGVAIDNLPFEPAAWPAGGAGISMQLGISAYSDTANDLAAAWCDSTTRYPDPAAATGDFGTPGAANGACPPSTTFFSTDLESDPSWTVAGDWEYGTPDASYASGPAACAGGTGCYGTNMDGDYSNSMNYDTNYVQAGPFDLSTAVWAEIDFDMFLVTETGWDFALVQASTDGTTFATVPMVTPAYGSSSSWTGTVASAWTRTSGSLADYAGEATVYLRWALDTDGSGRRAGFYIDNVTIQGL